MRVSGLLERTGDAFILLGLRTDAAVNGTLAIILEFTDVQDGRSIHKLIAYMRVDGKGYRLIAMSLPDEWPQRTDVFMKIFGTFVVGGTDRPLGE